MITIVAIDTQYPELTRRAIELTQQALPMPSKVLTFSDCPIIDGELRIPIQPMRGTADYNELCLKHLWPFIDTEHYLIVQYDGFAVNKDAWDDRFLDYDYIGAPWPWEREPTNVGNGGFSLRTKKLVEASRDPIIKQHKEIQYGLHEDVVLCRLYRRHLELTYNISFAPTDIATKFSYEQGHRPTKPFGLHGIWNIPAFCSREDTELFLFGISKSSWSPEKLHWSIQNCRARGWNDLADRLTRI